MAAAQAIARLMTDTSNQHMLEIVSRRRAMMEKAWSGHFAK